MHDIWNPWHGCTMYSEGCQNCYMFFLDKIHNNNGNNIFKTKSDFRKPLAKNRDGSYKIKSGELIRLCMTSDFFLPEADQWRDEVWNIISERPDVAFYILTKRAERIKENLPYDWNNGWDNVSLNVTCENQQRADERIPILLEIPAKHKGLMIAPILGEISIRKYLKTGQIEQVMCGGENYNGNRICDFNWIKKLRSECEEFNVKFTFLGIGNRFKKDGKIYNIKDHKLQSNMAFKANINFPGKPIEFNFKDRWGRKIEQKNLYKPFFCSTCYSCSNKPICNGCTKCGKCKLN